MWVKGAAISKFCVPTLGRLPSIKQVRAIRCELSFVVCRTQAGGPLALMFHGHTACVKFIAGNHISVLVATSNLDQVINQGWSLKQTNGRVHLCCRCFNDSVGLKKQIDLGT